jgi:hypothetical protein
MTTIACNRSQMAGDSLLTCTDIGTGAYLSTKVRRIGKSIFGECGENCEESGLAWEWLQSKRKPDARPEFQEDADFYFLELSPSGIFVWNFSLTRETVLEDNMAVGSGRKVALYCMRYLGMTPAEAVTEAAKVDHHTRAPVVVMDLK